VNLSMPWERMEAWRIGSSRSNLMGRVPARKAIEEIPTLMEPEVSLLSSQEALCRHYPERDESNPHHDIVCSEFHFIVARSEVPTLVNMHITNLRYVTHVV
jgi:hypothetical protein